MKREQMKAIEKAIHDLLVAVGENPYREGLEDTPARVARFWREFLAYNPGTLDTTFQSVQVDQMVVVSGMKVWSLCEHHLLPFHATVSVGYIAADKVLGLSKLGRLAHKHAHALQLQERLVEGIASEIEGILGHNNVGVTADGVHLCMTMRGIKTPAVMSTSVLRGLFKTAEARAEFYRLANGHRVG